MKFSVIVPMYNEAENVKVFLEELTKTLDSFSFLEAYEVLLVDDGSTDNTLDLLKKYKTDTCRIFTAPKNGGKSAALKTGIEHATFEVLGTLDGDLQNNPKDFEKLLRKLDEGYDLVAGARFDRKDNAVKRFSTLAARKVRQAILKDTFHDITSPIKVFRAGTMDAMMFFKTFHRFIPYLVQIQGFKTTQVGVSHRPRIAGKSKYGIINRLFTGIKGMLVLRWIANHYIVYDSKEI